MGDNHMKYEEIQNTEAKTWLIEDPKMRKEKAMREAVRYPRLKKLMGLNTLDTSDMIVWDIGAGPLGGVVSTVNCLKSRCIDPLCLEYAKYFDTSNYLAYQAEELDSMLSEPDLIIVTNALDHFYDPVHFLNDIVQYMKPGAYFAHGHAINNAITHPHDAHAHNVNPKLIESHLKYDFELVSHTDFYADGIRYGWVQYNGAVGQPAFYQLWRKVTGYAVQGPGEKTNPR